MPQLNQGFVNDVHYLDDTGAAGKSMGATFTTSKAYTGTPGNPTGGFCLDKGIRFAVQAVWTGTTSPVGAFTLNGSNDNVNFTQLSNSSNAVSGAGSFIWTGTCDYKFISATYTRTSGGASDTVVFTIRVQTRGSM